MFEDTKAFVNCVVLLVLYKFGTSTGACKAAFFFAMLACAVELACLGREKATDPNCPQASKDYEDP